MFIFACCFHSQDVVITTTTSTKTITSMIIIDVIVVDVVVAYNLVVVGMVSSSVFGTVCIRCRHRRRC